jgi:TfoX/Sxy family transcriptional regulator of competence genes
MPFDADLNDRLRRALGKRRGLTEKKMFGGTAFLLHGNMLVGVWREFLIARVGPEQQDAALAEPHAKPMDITGRPMRGWIMVAPEGSSRDEQLHAWIDQAVAFVATLEPKA